MCCRGLRTQASLPSRRFKKNTGSNSAQKRRKLLKVEGMPRRAHDSQVRLGRVLEAFEQIHRSLVFRYLPEKTKKWAIITAQDIYSFIEAASQGLKPGFGCD